MSEARKSLKAWLRRRGGTIADFAFPSRIDYLGHLSTRQYARLVDAWVSTVGLDKREYALRPALAIRALRHDPNRRPPMNLQELLRESAISAPILGMIDELVAAKRRTRELGNARRFPELDMLSRWCAMRARCRS